MTPARTTRQRTTEETREEARRIFLASLALGHRMSGLELGEHFGLTDSWGRARIREILDEKTGGTSPQSAPERPEPERPEPGRNDRNETTPAAAEERSLPPSVTPPAASAPSAPAAVEAEPVAAVPAEPERNADGTAPARKRPVVWPIALLMLPATVAIWSGWVGLGGLAGFGPVRPLPGIVDDFEINSAITLPIGMEVYAAYAMYVWLSGRAPARALRMARASTIIALAVGALGQVAYHVMVAAGVTAAPWWITAGVACLPVAVLGMGAALAHMVRAGDEEDEQVSGPVPPVPA
jgi:hypothetical protein